MTWYARQQKWGARVFADGHQHFLGNKAGELVANATSMRRLVSAAQPLVKTLDEDQKREALSLARSMGFGQLAARFE